MLDKAEETQIVEIDRQISSARAAQRILSRYTQDQIDTVVRALAWAIYRDDHAKALAERAVEDTRLGNVSDKILKNKRKNYGTLCDVLKEKTVGIVERNPERGLTRWSKPIGLVGTLTPSTNPAATPANQALMAIKGGNAIIVSPSPAGYQTAKMLEAYFQEALDSIGAPRDIFQIVKAPISYDKADYLARRVDLLIVTGDQANVRRGYSSGTPCIGVGKGNVPVIVDETADLPDAATKIARSKVFDNATSCSSENAVILVDDIYDAAIAELETAGGHLATPDEVQQIEERLFVNGSVNRGAVGQNIAALADLFGLDIPVGKRFILAPQEKIGPQSPLSGEKLSLVLAVYRASDFNDAMETCAGVLAYEGSGHSAGLHTTIKERGIDLAEKLDVARVLVNQAHTFGNGGGIDNALPFTLTMGCGSWGGNSISENLSIKNFVNTTLLVETFDKKMPAPRDAFQDFYDVSLDQT